MGDTDTKEAPKANIVLLILPAILLILSGMLTTWLWKLDDRQFNSQRDTITRQELHNSLKGLEDRLSKRFDGNLSEYLEGKNSRV